MNPRIQHVDSRPGGQRSLEGFIIPSLLALIIAFSMLMIVVSGVISSTLGSATRNQNSQMALNIAEAGVNYYLWHMSHSSNDYKDGKTTPSTPDPVLGYGPYLHDYFDGTGTKKGTFSLYIQPGTTGSGVITVRSKGVPVGSSSVSRTVQAKLGAPAFSTYAVVSNAELWFGSTEAADGAVHSNVGVKMDGSNSSSVTSSNATYVPSASSGNGSGTTRPGVWCDIAITTPSCAARSKASWRYPVPSVDFNKITTDLCSLKKTATNNQATNACTLRPARSSSYVPPRQTGFSNSIGYLITLNTNGTYTLSNVNDERDSRSNYTSALSLTTVASNIAIPASGVIFVEDNVWLRTEATGFDGRVTIASARLAVTGSTVATIVDNLLYKDKTAGNDSIGVIAENNVDLAPYVPAPLEVDGAFIAQTGRVQFRPRYNDNGNNTIGYVDPVKKLSFFGSIASNEQWTWSWVRCGAQTTTCWSGFEYNETKYDENLRYNPPPSFPVTSTYDILEWREIIATP